jgi:hypothetical protein
MNYKQIQAGNEIKIEAVRVAVARNNDAWPRRSKIPIKRDANCTAECDRAKAGSNHRGNFFAERG